MKNEFIIRPSVLRKILAESSAAERLENATLLNQAIAVAKKELEIQDLWEANEFAVTFWIFLMTSTDQEEEMEIAKTLLFWKTFSAKDSAKVICIPSSERTNFRLCSASFNASSYPTLIFGLDPNLEDFVRISPELLTVLSKERGGLQRFLTRVHSSAEKGTSLPDIEQYFLSEQFWAGLETGVLRSKRVYFCERKQSYLSISLNLNSSFTPPNMTKIR